MKKLMTKGFISAAVLCTNLLMAPPCGMSNSTKQWFCFFKMTFCNPLLRWMRFCTIHLCLLISKSTWLLPFWTYSPSLLHFEVNTILHVSPSNRMRFCASLFERKSASSGVSPLGGFGFPNFDQFHRKRWQSSRFVYLGGTTSAPLKMGCQTFDFPLTRTISTAESHPP